MSSLEQPLEFFNNIETKKYLLKSSTTNTHKVLINSYFEFRATHTSNRPDFTPRMWISLKPRSFEISWGGRVNNIHLKKTFNKSFKIIKSNDKSLYSDLYTFLLPDVDHFYINIQNLENFDNYYSIKLINNY